MQTLNKIVQVVLLFCMVGFSSCKRNCVDASYSIDAEGGIAARRNIFKVGDTLHFSYTFPKCAFEHIRQREVCLPELKGPTMRFGFHRYDSTALVNNTWPSNIERALAEFSITAVEGKCNQEGVRSAFLTQDVIIHFAAVGSKYIARFFVICRTPGLYSISNGHIKSRFLKDECKDVTARVATAWPTADYVQIFGVQDWQNHPQLSNNVFYIRVR